MLGHIRTHLVGPEAEYGCPQGSRSILLVTCVMVVNVLIQVYGDSSGFWRLKQDIKGHKGS